jgi:hypothetical protein
MGSYFSGETIPSAVYGLDVCTKMIWLEILAKTPDVNIHGALLDINLGTPYLIQQLAASEHPVGVAHEVVKQPELCRWQIQ